MAKTAGFLLCQSQNLIFSSIKRPEVLVSCVRRFQRRIVVQSFSARRLSFFPHFFPILSSILPRSFLEPSIYAQYMLNIC